ncbi:hypothetical protein BJ878DRAFT_538710 [Calycina marina]|uniref:Uncharacterized protein n=1 Tax=Calycina marina TaxID=1763456 RepID=A0A9P7Z9F6_9HELO|nr:hypothetical protein BJ878DRAFT_538710 [Calycina marina]
MNHLDLIKRGTAAYVFALTALGISLQSPKLAGKDGTLATCLILLIYELYEPTSNLNTAHEGHMAGIERLVQFRGVEQNETALGGALFKNITYALMVKSLQYRKTSRLKELIDQTVWWDMQGILFAKGHRLGNLLEDLDTYKTSAQHSLQASAGYLQLCAGLDMEFGSWYQDLLAESPSPIYWTSGNEPELLFPNINLALLLLDYWALRLALSTSIDIICSNVPD